MKNILENALSVLEAGGTILYPTETGWGIGCDATQEAAVSRICSIKNQSGPRSLYCLVGTDRQLEQLIPLFPEVAWDLIDLSEKPLVIIYDHPKGVAPNLVSEENTLGVCLTSHPFCRELLRRLRRPLVFAPPHLRGAPAPGQFSEIDPAILNAVDYVVPLEQESLKSKPPTLIKLKADGQVRVIRP